MDKISVTLAGLTPTQLAQIAEIVGGEQVNHTTRIDVLPAQDQTPPPPAQDQTPPPPAQDQTPPPPAQDQTPPPPNMANHDPGIERDEDGRPWDERIDASTKTKNKGDGRWKAKKGVDKEWRKQIVQQLIAQFAEPEPKPDYGDVPPMPGNEVGPSVFGSQTREMNQTPPPPTQDQSEEISFPVVLQRYIAATSAGMTQEQFAQILQPYNLPGVDIAHIARPDQASVRRAVYEQLGAWVS